MPKAEPGTGLAFLLSKRSDLPSLIRALVKLESTTTTQGWWLVSAVLSFP